MALSTAEAEYVASAACSAELLHISGLANELENTTLNCIMLMDNHSAISMLENDQNTKHSKHIDIKIHFVRDLVIKKVIHVAYVESAFNIADMFTKSLCLDKFVTFRSNLGVCNGTIPSRK